MSDESVNALLERLSSTGVDAAWAEFLAQYSPLIMHVIRRHEADDDLATECFIHVCAALSDAQFHRLRSFRPGGPARFKTWLTAVVANLCVDWRRREHGRSRPLRSVAQLPELEQQVYRCIYVRGMSRAQCLRVLLPQFPQLTERQLSEVNGRLFALLTPQQRWRLSMRRPRLERVVQGVEQEGDDPTSRLEEPGPEEVAEELQELELLQDALAQLPAEQRLLLRLRYEQDLTLAEVARLMRLPDPFRANRQIHAALEALAKIMSARQPRSTRKSR